MTETPMLSAQDMARYFDVSKPLLQRVLAREGKRTLRAVDGLSFDIPKGTTLSLVGESGCGKSTVARLVVGLYDTTRHLCPPRRAPTRVGQSLTKLHGLMDNLQQVVHRAALRDRAGA